MSICQFTNHQQISTNMFCNQTIFWANHIPHAPRFFASNSLTRSCICQSLCFLRGVFFSAGAAGVSGVLHARSFKAWKKKTQTAGAAGAFRKKMRKYTVEPRVSLWILWVPQRHSETQHLERSDGTKKIHGVSEK